MNRQQQAAYHEQFIQQLFRLFRISDMHDAQNQAVIQGAQDAVVALNALGEQSDGALSALFDGRDVFLNGQPLLAKRSVYEQSRTLGERLEEIGANELVLETPLTVNDLQQLVSHQRSGNVLQGIERSISPRVRLRKKEANPYTQISHDLPPQELVARTGAAAIVIIERLYEGLLGGDYSTVRYAKRIARNIVLLGERHPRLLLGFISSCPDRGDVSTLAVKGAILSTITLSQLTRDVRNMTDMALTALLYDVGVIRASGLMKQAEGRGLMAMPAAPEGARARLPESSAAMMTLFGAMGEASLARSIYLYEGHHIEHRDVRGVPYGGKLPPTIEGLILATVRRFLGHWMDLQNGQTETSSQPLTSLIDQAIDALLSGASTRLEHRVIDLMLRGMGITRRATPVKLSSGWQGVVVANHERPACFGRPIVRLMINPSGNVLGQHRDVDLSLPTHEAVLLGCVSAPIEVEPGHPLASAREAILSPPRRRALQPQLHSPQPHPEPDDNEAQEDSLAHLESISQVRKAPWLPIFASKNPDLGAMPHHSATPEPPIFHAPPSAPAPRTTTEVMAEDEFAQTSNVTSELDTGAESNLGVAPAWAADGQQLSWDDRDNTSHSLPSDRHQILNIADIAHMIPDAIADQNFEPIDFTEDAPEDSPRAPNEPPVVALPEAPGAGDADKAPPIAMSPPPSLSWGPKEVTDFQIQGPLSMPDAWDQIPGEISSTEDDRGDTSNITNNERSDQIFVLSGSFNVPSLLDGQGPATTLLPSNIIDAFQFRDRREHESRSEAEVVEDPEEMIELEVEPLTPSEVEALYRNEDNPDS